MTKVIEYNKSLGQHFIYDINILQKIVSSAGCIKNYNILEIGGGIGTLTQSILDVQPLSVTTIEKDKRFEKFHQSLQAKYQNYNFILANALEFDIKNIKRPCIIIANLPYNISTILLLMWLEKISHLDFLILMFQKEVASRITAKPSTKDYGIISVLTQVLCYAQHLFDLPPEAFMPRPKVHSTVIKLTPYKSLNFSFNWLTLKKILNSGFGQRRKMLKKNLLQAFGNKYNVEETLLMCNINQNARIEELSVKELAELSLIFTSSEVHSKFTIDNHFPGK